MQRDIVCSVTAIRLMEERCISIGYIDDVTLSYCSPRVGETRDLTGIPCHHILAKRADHPRPSSRLVLIFEKSKYHKEALRNYQSKTKQFYKLSHVTGYDFR